MRNAVTGLDFVQSVDSLDYTVSGENLDYSMTLTTDDGTVAAGSAES